MSFAFINILYPPGLANISLLALLEAKAEGKATYSVWQSVFSSHFGIQRCLKIIVSRHRGSFWVLWSRMVIISLVVANERFVQRTK